MTEGGKGVCEGPDKDDVIYEQPLSLNGKKLSPKGKKRLKNGQK